MATLPHSDSKRAYSWLWDSHISPKNSKWLQENLTDMDVKVKSMIKLIEEDADSFSRRAEMYYKKRPELMKLVEDFYRCYRALVERYNHATGELRHAHRTIARAFHDQDLPFDELIHDDSSLGLASEADKKLRREMNKEGFKKLKQMFEDRVSAEQQCSKSGEGKSQDDSFTDDETMVQLSNENRDLKDKVLHEAERAGKAESILQDLKKTLADMRAEKENVLLKYHKCLEKLSDVEVELNNARKDSATLNEEASRAEIEVRTLKEALVQLETEKHAGLVKHRIYSEKISDLEAKLSRLELESKGLKAKADASESEAQNLREEISRSQIEKEHVFQQHKECLERISVLENLISVAENNANMFKERVGRAENEVSKLKMSVADLKKEKEDFALKYKQCLETISKLEKDISNAREDVKRLNGEVLIGNLKLKTVEDKCALLEKSNLSLRAEADDLGQKISMKDQELLEKQEELENLQKRLLHEQSRHAHVEATLESIQSLRSRSQEEQRSLALELKNALQMLSDLETSKHGLEQEIQQVRDENQSLSETNLSSAVSIENMQSEIGRLRDLKKRLELEVSYQSELSESLQLETSSLKEEIQGLNMRYKALLEQVDASGLGQRNLATSVNNLKHENEKLRQMCEQESNEKEVVCKKLENMEELLKKKTDEEISLSDLTNELEKSRERMRSLQDSCQSFEKEKAMLITEKAFLIDQLQAITENMHNVLGKNAVLENSLSNARVELEGLREKSKGLDEICEILKNERCRLLSERETLVIKLENVEKRLEKMEEKYVGLEAQYAGLHQEKEAILNRADELAVSLSMEKQERANIRLLNETKLAGLEHQVQLLRDENKWKRKEFEDELDRAVKYQFEISILHKFMKDMEEKNTSLIVECQKHVEASKLAEKVISELESESLEQQVESELMLDEIERLRSSIYDVFNAIEAGPGCDLDEKFEDDESLVHHIISTIEDMKFSVTKHEDDKQLLLVENSVLLTLLEQFETKVVDVESQKACLEREFKIMSEKFCFAQNQKGELLETNANLKSEVTKSHQHNNSLDAELRILRAKESDLKQAYNALQEAYSQANRDNEMLLLKFSGLKKEKDQVECHNDTVLEEFIVSANDSIALKSFAEEKVAELKLLLVDLNGQFELNSSLQKEMNVLKEQLELQIAENLTLMDTVSKLETEMKGLEECNAQMRKDVISGTQTLLETEGKLLVKELKLEAAENANLKLCTEVDELNSEIKDSLRVRKDLEKNILQMSETNSTQRKEIERLNMVKTNLKSKLGSLHEEIKQITIREKALNTELSKKNKDFELWEADAASLYLDLQFRSINEILFGHKVMELSEVCQTLANENDLKTLEISQLKGKVSSMESMISGLKCQIKAYDPVIAALKDDITFLEHNALLQKNMKSANNEEQEFSEAASDPSRTSSEVFIEDQTLLSLQDLVLRIKAVSKLMEDTSRPVSRRRSSKQETKGEIENFKLSRCLGRDRNGRSRRRGCTIELSDTPKLQKLRSKGYEVRNRGLTKDIHQVSGLSLHGTIKNMQETDQIHELMDIRRDQMVSESLMMPYKTFERDLMLRDHNINHKSKNPSTDSDMERELGVDSLEISTRSIESSKEANGGARLLERLTSDAEKLEILHGTVETLRKKVETHKRSRKAKNVDFDTVYDQLLEAEETVISLVDMNDRLTKNVEEWPSPPNENMSPGMRDTVTTRRRRIAEQARRGSEKIFRLQLEIQKIQCVLLELDDEKALNKGKNKLFKSKAIILRDLIYNGGRKKNTKPKKKSRICGCVRPSTSSNGRG